MKTFSETTRKNVLSILVGPLAVIPAMLLMGVFTVVFFPEQSARTDWREVFNFFGSLITLIAYVLTVVVALPIVLVLQRFNQFTLPSVIFAALAIAGVLCLASSIQLFAFLYFSYFTVSVALACWGIHKWV